MRRADGREGEGVSHEHPPPTPEAPSTVRPKALLAGGEGTDHPLGSGPELTAEGGAGPWNLTAADGSAGYAAVQQGIPVLLLGAWLHGRPPRRACGAKRQEHVGSGHPAGGLNQGSAP